MNKEKCVIIHSGGLDSTVLLYDVLAKGYEPYVLSFNYGQKHKKELECAHAITQALKLDHKIIDITSILPLLQGSALTSPDKVAVPHEHYNAETQKMTVVPNRNAIMLSIAAGYAESLRAPKVFYAAHANDRNIYWDCRREFLASINQLFSQNDISAVKIEAPFVEMSKTQVVTRGIELNVPFAMTHSCYEGSSLSCGECGTCQERIEAFQLNKIIDPIIYSKKIDWAGCSVYNVLGGKNGN